MITSSSNSKIQQIRGLIARRKEREEAQQFVVEGVRLVEEALTAGYKPALVLYSNILGQRGRKLLDQLALATSEIEEISPPLMDAISGTETPQGILAVLPFNSNALPAALDFVVIADGLRDPGNLGSLMRTAAAAGVQAVLLTPTTTDVYAPKVVRAGMGAHFRLAVLALTWEEISLVLKNQSAPLRIFLAESERGKALWEVNLRQSLAILIGGEADGVSLQGHHLADESITIPMPGGSESLNAAAAASILLFEVVRQRHL